MAKKKVLLFANQNNGWNITNYLSKQIDADIKAVVVYDEKRKVWWKSVKELAKKNKLNFILFKDNHLLYEKIKNLDIDIIISASWRNIIPKEILRLAKIGAINFHNSLLPLYRSAYSNTWPLFYGDRYTGATIHWMTEKFDDGDIIGQKKFAILPWYTAREVWEKTNKEWLLLFKKLWPKIDQWKNISFPQKGKSSFYTIKDYVKTNEIDLNKKEKIGTFVNFLRSRTFLPYYQSAYFIDPKTKRKIHVSIILKK